MKTLTPIQAAVMNKLQSNYTMCRHANGHTEIIEQLCQRPFGGTTYGTRVHLHHSTLRGLLGRRLLTRNGKWGTEKNAPQLYRLTKLGANMAVHIGHNPPVQIG